MRFLLILLASIVIPYVWFNDRLASQAKSKWESLFGREKSHALASLRVSEPGGGADRLSAGDAPQLTGPTTHDLAEVLRFDVSPEWVTQRWSRVSTVLAEQDLEGLRVPLVTGTDLDDLAGSLTFYFDKQRRVQRISFHGRTGDDRKLISLVTSQFGMRAEPTLGVGMYVSRWNARPTSLLRLSYAPVVRSQTPRHRLEVALEINRPNAQFGLSEESAALLLQDRRTRRW
jgi:hypothetical protein